VAESLSINGTNLLTVMHSIQEIVGLVGAAPVRGDDPELPLGGAVEGAAWDGPRDITVRGLLYGNNGAVLVPADARARYLDRERALTALVRNSNRVSTLTRVIPRPGDGDLTTEARARYRSGLDAIAQAAFHAGRVAFTLRTLDAYWHATSDTTLATMTTAGLGGGSYTPTIAGDVETRRITITVGGTITGYTRLTNNTTGHWIEVHAVAAAATVVDVEAMTATRSGVSVAGSVTHNPAFDEWMALAPGVNSLSVTGGGDTVVLAYRGAYA